MVWIVHFLLGMLLAGLVCGVREGNQLTPTPAGNKMVGERCSYSSQCAEKLACVVDAMFEYKSQGAAALPTVVHARTHSPNIGVSVRPVPVELSPESVSQGTPGQSRVKVKLVDPLRMGGIFQSCPDDRTFKQPCLGTCTIKKSNPPLGYYREESSMTWKVRKWAGCHPTTGVPCDAGLVCQQLGGSADHFCLPTDFNLRWESLERLPDKMDCTGAGDLDGRSWTGTCKTIKSNFELRCYRNPAADKVRKDDGKCFIPRKKQCDPDSETFLCRPGTVCSAETRKCVDYQ